MHRGWGHVVSLRDARRFSREITFNVFVKNVIQPLVIFGAAWALGLKASLLAQTFLLGVPPTAT
jgi:malonate transporter and related proteins